MARPRKTASAAPYRLFFSYSHHNRWIARQCVRLLKEAGGGAISVFLAEIDIPGGELIAATVRDSIGECDEVLVLLTPHSRDSDWVLFEIGAAWGLGKRVVSVLDRVDPRGLPDLVRLFKAFDLNDFDDCVEQVVSRARGRIR